MKKYFAFFLALIIALGMLTGCGSSLPDAKSDPDIHYVGEGETEGGIKSDEEIASITEEAEENSTTTEEPSYEDNTGHEPDGYSTGNFQDYWQGDDYFDIVAFAEANGCDHIKYADNEANKVNDESEACFYTFYFNDSSWMVQPTIGCILIKLDSDYNRVAEYSVLYDDVNSLGTTVSISDKNNVTLSSKTIEAFVAVVNAVQAYPNSDDPLAEAGIERSQLR